jgi:excisionase family DNA binding protein
MLKRSGIEPHDMMGDKMAAPRLLNPQDFLTPEDLAELVRVPPKTIYQWNYRGTGPRFAKIGRHVRYRRADVEAWIEQQYGDPRVGGAARRTPPVRRPRAPR